MDIFLLVVRIIHSLVDLQVCIQQAHTSSQNLISVIIACILVFTANSQYFC